MRSTLQKIKTILKFVWQSSSGWTTLNIILVIVRGVLPLLLLYLVKMLVDEIQAVILLPAMDRNFTRLTIVLITAGFIFLVNALSASLSVLVREKQSYVITDFFDHLVHNKTSALEYSYYEHPDYQNIFYRALNEASIRPSRIFYGVMGVIQNLITLLVMGGVLLMVHWSVSLILLAVTLPIAWIRLKHARSLYRFIQENTVLEREVNYYNQLLTAPDFAKEIRAFDLSFLFRKRYEKRKLKLRQTQFRMLVGKTRREVSVQVLAAISLFLVYGMVAIKAFEGYISIGEVVLYFLAMQRGYSYLQELLRRLTVLYEDSLFIDNLFEFLQLKERQAQISDQKFEAFPRPLARGLEIKAVGFHYPSNKRWILKDISFSVAAGETVALVGANGSGKSTLVKLLCSLYQPVEGDILVDGIPLGNLSPEEKVKNISVIFQDFILYNVTARENIWFGNIHQNSDEERIIESAKKSGIHDVIKKFAKGYDSTLGTRFEGSVQMSPGQWQRLALARSFYNDAQLMILDEPTSSLDAFSEARLLQYIKSLTADRTSIIISHRLSTIKMADRIIVLEGGAIVESGTYNELSNISGGVFRQILDSL